jgi:hypothetical protein
MPKIHVELADNIYKLFDRLPKQVRGRFVNAALTHFLKTSEGQAIMSFLCDENALDKEEMPIKPIDRAQYPNLDDWSE